MVLILRDIIDKQLVNKELISPKITEVTSVFARNCFNCFSGENLEGVDYWNITRCEELWTWLSWLENSSWTPACKSFIPFLRPFDSKTVEEITFRK